MSNQSVDVERRLAPPPAIQAGYLRRISWEAILAGVVAAMSIQMVLSALGAGVGIIGQIWLTISSVLAFFCAGWTSGRLAGVPRAIESTLHGFLAWSLTLVIGRYLSGSAGFPVMILGAGAGALGGFVSRPKNLILTSLPSFDRRAAR